MSISFNEFFYQILMDYQDTFRITELVIPDYHIVENLAEKYLSLRPDVLESASVSIEQINQYNGFTIPPKTLDGVFTVLINKNVIVENMNNHRMDWVGTIVHETTHVQDFVEYARIVGAEGYDEILKISNHGMFNLWTEVHARANGYYFVRKYSLGVDDIRSPQLISDIVDRELPLQWKWFCEKCRDEMDEYQKAYLAAQYIGRLYTLHTLYPNVFTDEWIKCHFEGHERLSKWFAFHKAHSTLQSACTNFDEMRKIFE